jgi:hypothetical protein
MLDKNVPCHSPVIWSGKKDRNQKEVDSSATEAFLGKYMYNEKSNTKVIAVFIKYRTDKETQH